MELSLITNLNVNHTIQNDAVISTILNILTIHSLLEGSNSHALFCEIDFSHPYPQ